MELNGGQEVAPFVITYRKVFKRPKIEIVRRFVGFGQLVKNAFAKAREIYDEIAYDVQKNVIDPGESKAVHWAVNVRDPWESAGEAEVIASQVPGVRPPAGYHFEVIQILEGEQKPVIEPRNGVRAQPPSVVSERIRKSMAEDARNYGARDPHDDVDANK